MKLGAEPKKVAALAVLGVISAVVFYFNVLSGGESPRPAPRPAATATPAEPASLALEPPPASRPAAPPRALAPREFRPSLKLDRREQRPDPTTIDPTLRFDLLAKVQAVTLQGGERNLFQFGAAPAPKQPPEKKILPVKPETPQVAENSKPAEPPKPPPPPIPLKFYGYTSQARAAAARKRAFFLDGEDIIVAGEGELIKKRYKVVRIGINSAIVEDVEHKHQQTLALEELAS